MTSVQLSNPPPTRDETPRFGSGFHEAESEAGRPFRWMGAAARIELVAPLAHDGFVDLWVRCHVDDLSQHLIVTPRESSGAGHSFELVDGWNTLSIPVPQGTRGLDLAVDRILPQHHHPGDGRELALQLRSPSLHTDPARHASQRFEHDGAVAAARALLTSPLAAFLETTRELRYEQGFHAPELGEGQAYRWTAGTARLAFASQARDRFLELFVGTRFHDLSQQLNATVEGLPTTTLELIFGYNQLSILIPAGAAAVVLQVAPLLPKAAHPGDLRELGVMLRTPLLHTDAARHANLALRHVNRSLNARELLSGATELLSYPPKLGIDMAGVCNVKPACVYCDWDRAKALEGEHVDTPFDTTTLDELGPFYERAGELVNCSIGEPFMIKGIDPVLDAIGERGQLLELTTNGQILTDTNIKKLLGRHMHLYISFDAASPETYARLRNSRFELLVENVRRLVRAKGGPGHLPLVYAVFMPMRANLHELDAFVALCADLRVDRLVLRPLNPSPGSSLDWDRAGYRYEYQRELLPFDELVRVSGRASELCRRLGVELADQMDFGGDLRVRFGAEFERGQHEAAQLFAPPIAPPPTDTGEARREGAPARAARATPVTGQDLPEPLALEAGATDPTGPPPSLGQERLPACTEPWTSLYVLRRGVFPCCYGGAPMAPMPDYRQTWNAPLMREIRTELLAGRFHRYCFDSPDCPIVRKRAEAHDLSPTEAARLGQRRWLAEARRKGLGWAGRAYRRAQRWLRQ